MSIYPDFKPAMRLGAVITVLIAVAGFALGYHFPRAVELESTAPIAFHYEITRDAAKYLLLRDGPKCEVNHD
ncbi:hypothetical protein [Pseudomonas abietaniphila]|uniref:hypothetical protein n=1 Tax=Pseudomonas abietaniphila TaxID=89065 RepID=UPI000780C7A3|nr:hypothetical protein [Pseudomonas abietaniphila]